MFRCFTVFVISYSVVALGVPSSYNPFARETASLPRRERPMELLLALAGLTGLAVLLAPGSPLPSDADFKKAQDKLKDTPEDPDANTVVGKYMAFVQGNYDDAMIFLAKSSDKTLRTLAEHERAPLYTDTGAKKIGMGDEWVNAAKNYPALFRLFYDRASYWYTQAWPDMKDQPLWGNKLREQGAKLALARPLGMNRKGLPTGWKTDMGAPVLDGTIARTGSYSIKMPTDPQKETFLKSDPIPVSAGKTIEYSAWVRSDGTNSVNDEIALNYSDRADSFSGVVGVKAPMDVPFWNYVYGKAVAPRDVGFVRIIADVRSKKGTFWVDDMSLKIDGKEVLKNGSFEEK